MDCPFCKSPMSIGTIRGDPRGNAFRAEDGKLTPLGKYTSNTAMQCEDCGTIVLRGRFAEDAAPPADPYR